MVVSDNPGTMGRFNIVVIILGQISFDRKFITATVPYNRPHIYLAKWVGRVYTTGEVEICSLLITMADLSLCSFTKAPGGYTPIFLHGISAKNRIF